MVVCSCFGCGFVLSGFADFVWVYDLLCFEDCLGACWLLSWWFVCCWVGIRVCDSVLSLKVVVFAVVYLELYICGRLLGYCLVVGFDSCLY